MHNKWECRFLDLAFVISKWSKDPSTKVGAVIAREKIIISTGFNGFAQGIKDDLLKYNDRSLKYRMVLHAEENAILNTKEDLSGCTIYVSPVPPCASCMAKIIQVGIKTVVSFKPNKMFLERWKDDIDIAQEMLKEVNGKLIMYEEIEHYYGS